MFMKNLIEKIKLYGIKTSIEYVFMELLERPIRSMFFKTYSQKGEDIFIDKYLSYKKDGFYVDVGANDPDRFSNTKRFYNKKWNGINIEPDVDNYNKFFKKRMRDINLNIGIGQKISEAIFYKFETDTLSTFSKNEAEKYKKQGYKLKEEVYMKIDRLENIFSQYLNGRNVDFLSIDTEGFDVDVLKSNDWNKFKPKLICIESVSHDVNNINSEKEDGHELFLNNAGYKKIYDNKLNSIFVLNKFNKKCL